MSETILIIGSSGQIGTELVLKLREVYGNDNVIASDIRKGNYEVMESGPFELLDVTKKEDILEVVKKYNIKQVYLMAAMLSALAEKNPKKAWDLNMNSLFNILDLAKEKIIERIFWPSSIAVFGPDTPRQNTPQQTIIKPTTVYGISKLAGENWCSYYKNKYSVDVRSVRYPGIISYKTTPGGGTTDYAVEIFYEAIRKKKYTCFLSENTKLPMMYMDDAIEATIKLMQSEKTSKYVPYNISAMSFAPDELAEMIKKYIPEFEIFYRSDSRQEIANSWPESINDSQANKDWGWQSNVNLQKLVESMLLGLHYSI